MVSHINILSDCTGWSR